MLSETHGVVANTSDHPSGGYPQGIVMVGVDSLLAEQAVDDAHENLGHWVAIRRKIRPEDGVARCSVCYDDIHGSSDNPACTTCWGTTFEGGYYTTQITRAIFRNMRENIELTRTGVVRVLVPEVTIGSDPNVKDGDLMVRIEYNRNTGVITDEKERYWIRDVQNVELAPDYERVGQRFSVTQIQFGDPALDIPLS